MPPQNPPPSTPGPGPVKGCLCLSKVERRIREVAWRARGVEMELKTKPPNPEILSPKVSEKEKTYIIE